MSGLYAEALLLFSVTSIWRFSRTKVLHFFFPFRGSENESEVAQSCPTLCDPIDCSLPGSSVQEIFQARVLEWVADDVGYLAHKDDSCKLSLGWLSLKSESVTLLIVSDSLRSLADYSPPCSSVHWILQARILEWVASSFSRGMLPTQGSKPGLPHCR